MTTLIDRASVTFPRSVFDTAETKTDLEDWLMANDPEFLENMRMARKEDLQGKGKSWEAIKKDLCIK